MLLTSEGVKLTKKVTQLRVITYSVNSVADLHDKLIFIRTIDGTVPVLEMFQ